MTNTKTTANKGEWSEVYTLLYLLINKKVELSNEKLEAINQALKILNIYWVEGKDIHTFNINQNSVTNKRLIEILQSLYSDIISTTGTFTPTKWGEIKRLLNINDIKSSSFEKTDIELLILNQTHNTKDKIGFSIKSFLGSNPTIINASSHTKFIYKVIGLTSEDIKKVNKLNTKRGGADLTGRVKTLYQLKGGLEFYKMSSEVYKENLVKVDSLLPEIIANLLINSYKNKAKYLYKSIENFTIKQTLINSDTVKHKIGSFVYYSLSGLMPSLPFDNIYTDNGVLIVKKEGNIVGFYNAYNKKELWEFLSQNVYLDTPSTSRHNIGTIYKEINGDYFIDLSLQLRISQP